MRTSALVAALFGLIQLGWAQLPAGGGGPPPPPGGGSPDRVVFGPYVRGLSYSSTTKPYGSNTPGTQEAVFSLSVSYSPPPGWWISDYIWLYVWKPPSDPIEQYPEDVLIIDPPGTGPSAVGRAYAPGVYRALCVLE